MSKEKKQRTPQVGDLVTHDGCWPMFPPGSEPYQITGFVKKAALDESGEPTAVRICVFENARYRVECLASELEWLDEDGAWMLPGRLLSRAQRRVWQQQLGIRQGPDPAKHVEARAFLLMRLKPDELFAATAAAQAELDELARKREEASNG